jgi:formate dehydrogenase subunit beta
MEALQAKAKELLAAGTVKVVIGYGKGTADRCRPIFVLKPERAGDLMVDAASTQNLATYLTKHEVRALGRMAIVAVPSTLRSILQLAAEKQLREENVLALAVLDGGVRELASFAAIEETVATIPDAISDADRKMIDKLVAMSVSERRAFWAGELNRCVKCYACRSSCPMCYCERCTTDCNRPQWIPVSSHAIGNLEYHMMRAMHLAGRCGGCAECERACPMDIPLNLLNRRMAKELKELFDYEASTAPQEKGPLNSYLEGDDQSFIK